MKLLKLLPVLFILTLTTVLYAQDRRLVLPSGTINSYGKKFVSNDASLIATTGFKEPVISVWDVRSGYLIASLLDTNAYSGFKQIYFFKKKYLVSDDDSNIKIWDLTTAKCIFATTEEQDGISKFERNYFSETANVILSTYSDKILYIDLNKAAITKELHFNNLRGAELSADGKLIIAVTKSGFKFIETSTWKTISSPEGKRGTVSVLPNNKVMISSNTGLEIYDQNNLENPVIYPVEGVKTTKIVKKKNEVILATSTAIHIYNIEKSTAKIIKGLKPFTDLIVSPDGDKFIISQTGSRGEKISNVIDLDGKVILFLLPDQENAFTSDGKQIIQINAPLNEQDEPLPNATVTVWDTALKKKQTSWKVKSGELEFIPRANKILNTDQLQLKLLNLNGITYGAFNSEGHVQSVQHLALSTSEKYLASDANIWDAATLQLKLTAGIPFSQFSTLEHLALFSETAEDEDEIKIELWNIAAGKLLIKHNRKARSAILKGAEIGKKEDKLFIASSINGLNELAVYDIKRYNAPAVKVALPSNEINAFHLSPDGAYIIISYLSKDAKGLNNSFTEIRSVSDFKVFRKINGASATFGKQGGKLLTILKHQKIYTWDSKQYQLLKTITLKKVVNAAFSPDEQKIVTDQLQVIDLNSQVVSNLKADKDFDLSWLPETSIAGLNLDDFGFTPDAKNIFYKWYSEGSGMWSYTIDLWDAGTGLPVIKTDSLAFNTFISENKQLQLNVGDQNSSISDILTKKEIWLKSQTHEVKDAVFTADNRFVFISQDNSISKFDAASGNLLSASYAIDHDDYITTIPSGYYMSTPKAAKLLHYVTKELKTISFNQLDIQFNRPDKVLQNIGNTDTAMISSYRKAYEKRLKKLGIDTTFFKTGYSVPEADFMNRDQLLTDQTQQKIALHITGSDSTTTLDRFNVWINENPVFGIKGASLKGRNTHRLDTVIYVNLSDGKNTIETSVTNVNETESFHMPVTVNYIPVKKTREKFYFVGIGIDRFEQSGHDLKWSVKDIRDQAAAFKLKYGNNISIDTLFNENVSVAAVTALKNKLNATNINDIVVIAYSGHGMLSKAYDYYLSTYKIDFKDPAKNGLLYDDLEQLLDDIPARQKLMMIDACHSGELDKDEVKALKAAMPVMTANKYQTGSRGIEPIDDPDHKLGLQNSFELMQALFSNVSRNTGATIISAAGGMQFALEKDNLKNGVFSYSLLEYMKANPKAHISELRSYINKRVSELTSNMQVPTSRSETAAHDWYVWQ